MPRDGLELALADRHRQLGPDSPPMTVEVAAETAGPELEDVFAGAGFGLESLERAGGSGPARWRARLRWTFSLPDTVGPDMTLLVCGLNPSPYSAESGIPFGRPGNRFWPAALAAGLAEADRDPRQALAHHQMGMTDIVKRTTRKASELKTAEYRSGLARVERLVARHRPNVVCFVGLAGWRAAVNRKAIAGSQPNPIGDTPVYLMPSTSGLNAATSLDQLTEHLRTALALANQRPTG